MARPLSFETNVAGVSRITAADMNAVQNGIVELDGTTPTVFRPETYGAVADGITDDATAIQAAFDAALAAGGVAFAVGTFAVGSTVTLACDADLGAATFTCTSTSIAPVLRIGTTSTSGVVERIAVIAPKVTNTTLPVAGVWTGTSVGVEIANLQSSDIRIPYVRGFVTGLLMTAYGANGNVHNTVRLGHLRDNKVQHKLSPNATTSWVNDNTFLGGRMSHGSSQGSNKTGVRQMLLTASVGGDEPNNNRWIGTSVEGDCPEYHLEIQNGTHNYWDRCRWETVGVSPKVYFNEVSSTEFAQRNHIFGGVYSDNIVVTQSTNAKRNRITGTVSDKVEASGSTSPLLAMLNKSSGDNPIICFYNASQSVLTAAVATAWEVFLGSRSIRAKGNTDTESRFVLDCSTGQITRGPGGSTAPNSGIYHGSGTPEGSVTAGVGSIYQRTNGGAGTSFYVKESGAGNTGWTAK